MNNGKEKEIDYEKRKKINKVLLPILGIILLLWIINIVSYDKPLPDRDPQGQKQDLKQDTLSSHEKALKKRQERIEKQFSGWDGSHRNLEKLIKQNMNDPDSYEHIETGYKDMVLYILVSTKFRGANAFGGKVINTVSAKVDLDGNVLEIINQN